MLITYTSSYNPFSLHRGSQEEKIHSILKKTKVPYQDSWRRVLSKHIANKQITKNKRVNPKPVFHSKSEHFLHRVCHCSSHVYFFIFHNASKIPLFIVNMIRLLQKSSQVQYHLPLWLLLVHSTPPNTWRSLLILVSLTLPPCVTR